MDQAMSAWNRTKEQLILLLSLIYTLVLIINNGIILTDRTDGRKYLQRIYSDL